MIKAYRELLAMVIGLGYGNTAWAAFRLMSFDATASPVTFAVPALPAVGVSIQATEPPSLQIAGDSHAILLQEQLVAPDEIDTPMANPLKTVIYLDQQPYAHFYYDATGGATGDLSLSYMADGRLLVWGLSGGPYAFVQCLSKNPCCSATATAPTGAEQPKYLCMLPGR